jgi:hypothetical protein
LGFSTHSPIFTSLHVGNMSMEDTPMPQSPISYNQYQQGGHSNASITDFLQPVPTWRTLQCLNHRFPATSTNMEDTPMPQSPISYNQYQHGGRDVSATGNTSFTVP